MDSGFRLMANMRLGQSGRLQCWVLGSVLLLTACGGSDNARRFAGEYVYVEGQGSATCAGQRVAWELNGMEASVEALSDRTILFSAGMSCQMELAIEGSTAEGAPGQTCELTVLKTSMNGRFANFRLRLAEDDGLRVAGDGTLDLTIKAAPVSCEQFEVAGLLKRKSGG
jgi:hypothetical protein